MQKFTMIIFACFCMLSGCKEVLYSELSEQEANDMLAVLASSDISASRSRDKKTGYSLLVDSSELPVSIILLRNEGYPKTKFESLGDVFSADGIVGTPFEQHARFLHAMNQELSHTITSINGVKSARVLVTSPAKERYSPTPPKASASVTINYEETFEVDGSVSKIKTLVAHSLPNLDYDDVTVALFAASGPELRNPPSEMMAKPAQSSVIGDIFTNPQAMAIWRIVLVVWCIFTLIIVMLIKLKVLNLGKRGVTSKGNRAARGDM